MVCELTLRNTGGGNGTLDSSDSFGGGNGFGSGRSDCVELGVVAVGISVDAAGSASGAGGPAGIGRRDSGDGTGRSEELRAEESGIHH